MSFDGFIQFDKDGLGIKGSSTDDAHKGDDCWCGLLGFDFGVDLPTMRSSKSGGSVTTERANFKDITITKELDKASPKLLEALAKGAMMKKVVIELCRPLAAALGSDVVYTAYLTVTLEEAYVTKVDSFCSATYALPMEAISMNYGKITVKYQQLDLAKGGVGSANVEIQWDCNTNRGSMKS